MNQQKYFATEITQKEEKKPAKKMNKLKKCKTQGVDTTLLAEDEGNPRLDKSSIFNTSFTKIIMNENSPANESISKESPSQEEQQSDNSSPGKRLRTSRRNSVRLDKRVINRKKHGFTAESGGNKSNLQSPATR